MSNTGRVPDGGAADSSLLKRVVDLADAIVTPTVFDESSHSYSGCVHDCLGRVVPESQRTSTHEWRTSDPEVLVPPEGIEELEGIGLYLGHYTRAYGHFLLETLSRVWGIGAGIPYDKVIFQPWWLDLGGSPLEPTP